MLFTNGLPSVLYETPGLNERSVLNQLFLMISGAFHMKSAMLFTKSATFHEKHCSSWKVLHFMKSTAFHMKCGAFHEMWCFSWNVALFVKSIVLFIWKAPSYEMWCFSWNAVLFMKSGTFCEKHCTFHMKSTWNH